MSKELEKKIQEQIRGMLNRGELEKKIQDQIRKVINGGEL